ncbi:MAG: CvpA family protein [Saprospiraceae bacterium]|nr:CvpA family protein [Saprospiraceae bacterium]
MIIDILFALAFGYGFLVGYSKGILETVFKIFGYLIGVVAAIKFALPIQRILEDSFDTDNPAMYIVGLLLSFLLTMMIVRFAANLIENMLEKANINIINQVFGGLLVSGFMVLIYSLLLYFAKASHLISNETERSSYTYEYLEEFPDKTWTFMSYLKDPILEFWEGSVDFIDKLGDISEDNLETKENVFDIEEKTIE